MGECTLLAGDIDFHPLIDALVREGMLVTLWHPPQAPADLVNAADIRTALTAQSLNDALVRPNGEPLFCQCRNKVRPRGGDTIEAWSDDFYHFELRLIGTTWFIERFDPNAAATSEYFLDEELRPLLRSAEDAWQLVLPGPVETLLQGSAA